MRLGSRIASAAALAGSLSLCAGGCSPPRLVTGVPLVDRPGCEAAYPRAQAKPLDPEDAANACHGELDDCIAKCKADNMHSCATLAVRFLSGDGVKKDAERGRGLASLACEGGITGACVLLGTEQLHWARNAGLGSLAGDPRPEPTCRAFYALAAACQLDDLSGCDAMQSLPRDYFNPDEALEIYGARRAIEEGCTQGGRADACLYCTYRYFDPDPAEANLYLAAADQPCLEKSCELGDEAACVGAILGRAELGWRAGSGAVTDTSGGYAFARSELMALCGQGNQTACAYRATADEQAQAQAAARRRDERERAAWAAGAQQREATALEQHEATVADADAALRRWNNRHRDAARRASEASTRAGGGGGGLNARDRAILDNINSAPSLDSGCAGGYYASSTVAGTITTRFVCP